jgi:hypothetical protein
LPKVEKAIHLDAFKLYMEMGGMSPAFLSQFVAKFGKTDRTAQRWEKDLGWRERIKKPVDDAVEDLSKLRELNAEELISGFLDLCRTRVSAIGIRASYIEAIFATAFERIPSPENPHPDNPLEIKSIEDMERIVRMQSLMEKEEQAWAKLSLLLVGEPDSRMEMIIKQGLTFSFSGNLTEDDI